MRCHWKALIIKTSVWLLSEVVLNLCGTDTIADYSEFLMAQQGGPQLQGGAEITLVA